MEEPEWLNTQNTESGVFDHTGNFSEGIVLFMNQKKLGMLTLRMLFFACIDNCGTDRF